MENTITENTVNTVTDPAKVVNPEVDQEINAIIEEQKPVIPDPLSPAVVELSNKYLKNDVDLIRYAINAIAKDDSRPTLACLKFEVNQENGNCFVYGANGYVLHIAKLNYVSGIVNTGLYKVVKATKTSIVLTREDNAGNYPNIWQVIPQSTPDVIFNTSSNFNMAYAKIIRNMADDNALDVGYLKASSVDDDYYGTVEIRHNGPVVIKTDYKTTVIMPLFAKDNAGKVKSEDQYEDIPVNIEIAPES